MFKRDRAALDVMMFRNMKRKECPLIRLCGIGPIPEKDGALHFQNTMRIRQLGASIQRQRAARQRITASHDNTIPSI